MPVDNIYENLEEAQFRLLGTVVAYDGKPCYIQNIESHRDGVLRLYIVPLPCANLAGHRDINEDIDEDSDLFPPNSLVRKKINSPKFNRFRTIPLGYLNFFENDRRTGRQPTMAHYVQRIPVRRSKQGLDHSGVSIQTPVGGTQVSFQGMVASTAFYEMVMGIYPSYSEAYGRLVNNSAIGVTREFALMRDIDGFPFLVHQNRRIGIVDRDRIILGRNWEHMREEIIECEALPNDVSVF